MGACTSHKHKRQDHEPMSRQDFQFVRQMGRGAQGAVWKVIDQSTKCSYALKVIDKVRVIANKCAKATVTEKLILAHLAQTESPFIVKLHAAFQDQKHLYLLMDFIEGDSLRNYLIRGLTLSEEDIKCLCSCILGALQCLRTNCIIHRDVKPENIIIGRKGRPLLVDFGISSFFSDYNAELGGGTIGYMAPQLLLEQNHGFQADYFSFGIIVFELFFKKRPYISLKRSDFVKQITKKPMKAQNFPQLGTISAEACDFLIKVLQRKPRNRLGCHGVSQLRNHPWMANSNRATNSNWSSCCKEKTIRINETSVKQPQQLIYDKRQQNFERILEQGYIQEVFKDYNYLPTKNHLALSTHFNSSQNTPI